MYVYINNTSIEQSEALFLLQHDGNAPKNYKEKLLFKEFIKQGKTIFCDCLHLFSSKGY